MNKSQMKSWYRKALEVGRDDAEKINYVAIAAKQLYQAIHSVIEDVCLYQPYRGISLLDAGCGLGGLLDYIDAHGSRISRYRGVDFLPEYVSACRRKFRYRPDTSFKEADLEYWTPREKYDIIVINGVFTNNFKGNGFGKFIENTLDKLFPFCEIALVFSYISSSFIDYHLPGRYYMDFSTVYKLCSDRTRFLRIIEDFPQYLGVAVMYQGDHVAIRYGSGKKG